MNAEQAGAGEIITKKRIIIAHLLAVITVLIWAANHSIVKDVTAVGGTESQFLIRYAAAGIIMAVFFLIRKPKLDLLTRSDWILVGLLGLLCGPAYHWFLSMGSLGTAPALMSMLVALQTFHVGWLGYLLLKEKINAWHWGAMVIAFIGISMPVFFNSNAGNATKEASLLYPILVLISGFIASVYVVGPRKLGPRIRPGDLMGLTFILGFILGLPFALKPDFMAQIENYEIKHWGMILWMGTFGMILPVWCWWTALRTLRAMTVALYTFLMIVASGVWGWLLLGVGLGWPDAVAMGVVLVALFMNLKASREANAKTFDEKTEA